LELELRHKGTSVATASLVAWSAVAMNDPADGLFGGAGFEPTPEELTAPGAELEGWEFQVTGTPKDTLNLWGTDRWWRGQFSMPLAEAFDVVKTR
jgi:hypothetical protein